MQTMNEFYSNVRSAQAVIAGKYNDLCRIESTQLLLEALRTRFQALPITTVLVGKDIYVNEYGITGISRDTYNNLFCSFTRCIPVEYLRVLAELFCAFRDNACRTYKYRATQQLLILFWQKFYKELTAEDTLDMVSISESLPCENNNRDLYGFVAWLTTRSYLCNPWGAIDDHSFIDWPHRASFKELFLTYKGW